MADILGVTKRTLMTFRDVFAIEWIDDREDYGEERVNLPGICDGVILHVTYTERRDQIRIISARRAEREPDQSARAYLTVIAHDPEGAKRALARNRL